jgi:hypothetical protein
LHSPFSPACHIPYHLILLITIIKMKFGKHNESKHILFQMIRIPFASFHILKTFPWSFLKISQIVKPMWRV